MTNAIIEHWANGTGEIHFLLGLVLFILSNWIGKHSFSVGYVTISVFAQNESAPAAPAFNYVIRVFTPIVYLIISSAILYAFKLDVFVTDFYMVSVYYVVIRFMINMLQGRAKLINWLRQMMYYISIISISWVVYTKFIITKSNILPDFTNVANEMWIIIILFLYKIVNDLTISQASAEQRKKAYLDDKFKEVKAKFGSIVDKEIHNDILKAVVYAIIIYENFNRSAIVRWMENINFHITGKPHTLGIMQMSSKEFINDMQSVSLGAKKIRESYDAYRVNFNHGTDVFYYESMGYGPAISDYNGGLAYRQEVEQLTNIILYKYYSGTKDTLNPAEEKVSEVIINTGSSTDKE